MREATRQQYLKTMGIQLWMPRFSLPNAPESPLLAAVGSSVAEAPDNRANSSTNQPHSAGQAPSDRPIAGRLLDASPASQPPEGSNLPDKTRPSHTQPLSGDSVTDSIIDASAADAAQKQPQASLASEPIDLTPPRFELHFTRVGRRGVWVCDDADQLALLEGFARRVAMAMAMPFDPSLRIPSFRWPFIEQGREDQSSAVAKQALVAQWQFLRTQGVSYVVSFGPNAKDWLTRVEAKGYLTDQPLGSWIQQPGSKRALWLRLLDIQQREHQEL
jgi:hypothetical protein